MKIVIVEDDVIYSELIQRYVAGLADEVVSFTSWKAAQNYLEEHNFDIGWFDLLLPGDTVDSSLLRITEVHNRNQDTVILVVSGVPELDIEQRALKAGADAYLNKNVAVKRNHVIALIMLALTRANERGVDTKKLLEKAQQFYNEQVKPNQTQP